MKTALVIAALFLAVPRDSTAQGDEQQIRALLREWDNAYLNRDTAALARILADEFRFEDAGGVTLTKAEYLMSLVKAPDFSRVESFESTDVAVVLDGDKAVVTGRSRVKGRPRGSGQAFGGDYRFTDTWIKRNQEWRAIASRATRASARR